MAKFIVFAAVMVALLALAQASRFTITTTVDEEGNQQGMLQQRCQPQIQQQSQQLQQCQQYLQSQMSPFQMDIMNQQYGQQHRMQCCQGLQNIQDEQCRCEAVRMMMKQMEQQQQGQGGWQGQGQQQMQEMKQKARFLPRECNVGPQECQI